MRTTSIRIISLVLALLVMSSATGCKQLEETREKLLTGLNTEVGRITKSVDNLQLAVDEQRGKLTADVQATLAVTIASLRDLIAQMERSVRSLEVGVANLKQELTADLTGTMTQVRGTVDSLSRDLTTASVVSIREASARLEEQRVALLAQTHQLVQETVRPVLADMKQQGDYFVGRVTREAHVALVRIVSGLIAIVALIGLIVVLVKLKQAQLRWPAVGITSVIFLCGVLSATALAQPIAGIGSHVVKIPSPVKVCSDMSVARDAFKADPTRENAIKLKDAAVECQIVAPTAELAAQAKQAFQEASIARNEEPVCTTHADCEPQGKRCDIAIRKCVDNWCDSPSHCEAPLTCDMTRHRCMPPGETTCSSPADCRAEQSCDKQTAHCVKTDEIPAADCEVTGALGACHMGKLGSENRWVVCKQTVQGSVETCDGVDNNCNGTVDEGIARAEYCIASGAQGECASLGTWTCTGASGWTCAPGSPRAESTFGCDGKDNDCDGTVDNGLPEGAPCSASFGECAKQAKWQCIGGQQVCVAGQPTNEVCDGLDNNCDNITDPAGTCPEVVIRQQSDSDNGGEMTWRPRLPTDLIDGEREHGGPCGEDDHGRPYHRTRAEVSAASSNGATCSLSGPFNGFVSNDPTDCRIRVHYKTVRWGSNVWCSGTWWGTPVGAYLR